MICIVHQIIQEIILRRMRWARQVKLMTEKINAYRILVVKPEVKTQKGRPKYRSQNNIT